MPDFRVIGDMVTHRPLVHMRDRVLCILSRNGKYTTYDGEPLVGEESPLFNPFAIWCKLEYVIVEDNIPQWQTRFLSKPKEVTILN